MISSAENLKAMSETLQAGVKVPAIRIHGEPRPPASRERRHWGMVTDVEGPHSTEDVVIRPSSARTQ